MKKFFSTFLINFFFIESFPSNYITENSKYFKCNRIIISITLNIFEIPYLKIFYIKL